MTKEEIKQFIENGIYSRFLDGRCQTAYGESTVIRIVHDILKQVKNNGVLVDVMVSEKDCRMPMREFGSNKCLICGKQVEEH